MFKTKRLILLLGIFTIIITGCKNNSKTENGTDDTSTSKTETGNGSYAIIHLDDGRDIELDAKTISGKAFSPNLPTASLTDYSLLLLLRLNFLENPVEEKSYDVPYANITLQNVKKDGPLTEVYRTQYKSADGKEGKTTITITSIGDTHSEGTFSGTLYSKNHKKAVIEGKFNIKKK
ncbi:hypothetical protein Aeqsu_2102 [Aequorivita sublithincola DSM 14238]|uniref:Lipoprotein n=1 Tax=Aequorivita sublithincola (strain DSM 14238 / LMG 21431 / ACAM 643 / 9-3) TaxID=746697 RepID=I3YX47_AEQSU|nr:hypothetical protein [Aequorivita sublithincola]AFL81565.1 hypothetical protein Aeqsu_2102 [Aequorivita sublithincola DSM 14238]